MNKTVLIGTLAIIVLLTAILILQGKATVPQTQTQNNTPVDQLIPTEAAPIPTSSIKTESVQATVSAVSKTSISVQGANGPQTFSITNTKDIQKLTSGSLENGKVTMSKATIADVKAGQKVMLVVNSETKGVISLFILR